MRFTVSMSEDQARLHQDMGILLVMCAAVLTVTAYLMVRRNVMTVFKGYLKIAWKNRFLIFLYLGIFRNRLGDAKECQKFPAVSCTRQKG